MKYLFNGISLQNKRQSNMDSLLLKCGSICNENALLSVVCDGVGSLEHGAFASGTAVRRLSEWFDKITAIDRIGLKMRDAILDINNHIVRETRQQNINAASTLSALLLIDGAYYIAHVGDSRIYSCEDKSLTLLTTDDISATGKLTACIGQNENIVVQYMEGLVGSKIFLICSDGLYKRMDNDFMLSKIKLTSKRALNDSLEALTQHVINCGEKDNISIALIKIEN